ncbi:hypothetical protein OESDEN_00162 [Oesophagostomum dentatum]|uniref:Methyltransferase domain-containing protein n=1 Tax=Oesophagostomum dentatum TaxID=61180 RepID=A0A0B1TQJ8_OESDE|nr:hypothetical protein OESDEN_00162 [Oesophagostomum dentatum]
MFSQVHAEIELIKNQWHLLSAPPIPNRIFVIERLQAEPDLFSGEEPSAPSKRMAELYKAQVLERQFNLKFILKNEPRTYNYLYDNLAPEAYCPELVRLGTTNDGGKWICSPFRVPDTCTVFSVGLFNEVTFEQELYYVSRNRCRIFAYDKNKQSRPTLEVLKSMHAKVREVLVGATTDASSNQYALKDLMELEGVTEIDILKVDIESMCATYDISYFWKRRSKLSGSEFAALPDFLREYTPAQILVEIHGKPARDVKLLNFISHRGYWLYSYEVNGYYHNLTEYSFIHDQAMRQYGAVGMAKYLNFSH